MANVTSAAGLSALTSSAASQMAARRFAKMTAGERKALAKKAANARWKKKRVKA